MGMPILENKSGCIIYQSRNIIIVFACCWQRGVRQTRSAAIPWKGTIDQCFSFQWYFAYLNLNNLCWQCCRADKIVAHTSVFLTKRTLKNFDIVRCAPKWPTSKELRVCFSNVSRNFVGTTNWLHAFSWSPLGVVNL